MSARTAAGAAHRSSNQRRGAIASSWRDDLEAAASSRRSFWWLAHCALAHAAAPDAVRSLLDRTRFSRLPVRSLISQLGQLQQAATTHSTGTRLSHCPARAAVFFASEQSGATRGDPAARVSRRPLLQSRTTGHVASWLRSRAHCCFRSAGGEGEAVAPWLPGRRSRCGGRRGRGNAARSARGIRARCLVLLSVGSSDAVEEERARGRG